MEGIKELAESIDRDRLEQIGHQIARRRLP
jgi:hypothetical protein